MRRIDSPWIARSSRPQEPYILKVLAMSDVLHGQYPVLSLLPSHTRVWEPKAAKADVLLVPSFGGVPFDTRGMCRTGKRRSRPTEHARFRRDAGLGLWQQTTF